ncbi:hypothetical protein MLD38_010618 [Melastoma candidum]|uniref:Uncharacterized protein n=1 Tax=Melastoma candidum TaxID=119954 RepID=A0ACB9R4I9_9MYRT|nr:hypothetical protein MLD38_010618 [Melastoma candidum]
MFFSGLIKSKILSLLRPYLSDPPGVDLHLRLGPITSVVTATNLHLHPSAVNEVLLEAPYDFAFKTVVIEEVTLVFSAWASRAIDLTVRGVRIVVSAGESEQRCTRTARVMEDVISEDLRKRLSAIDPEGYVLHEALQKLLSSLDLRGNTRSAFLNLIYKHCQLHVMDVCLDLEFPVLGDFTSWFSGFEELHVVSRNQRQGCILRGLAGLLLVPSRDSSFEATGSGFNIGYRINSQTNCNVSCKGFEIRAFLKDLSLSNLDFQTPEFSLTCSPADIAFLLNSNKALSLSQKVNHGKRGRQLWKLAARRIRELYLLPRYSLHKLFRFLILWMHYVNTYKSLLLLVGYPDRDALRRSCMKSSYNITFQNDLQNHWKQIMTLEKNLSPNAIAQAWMVARHRASDTEFVHLSCSDLCLYRKFLAAITKCLIFIWYVVFNVFYCIWQVLSGKPSLWELKYKFRFDVPVDGLCQKKSYSFQIGKAVLRFCKITEVCSSVSTSVESRTGISYVDFLSFHVIIGAASVRFAEEIFEQSLLICFGTFTVSTAPTEEPAPEGISSIRTPKNKNVHRQLQIKSETVISCDPVDLLALTKSGVVNDGSSNLGCDESSIMTSMRMFCEGWQNEFGNLRDSDAGPSENPFLLCEVGKHVSSPDPKISCSGLWKCTLLVGKIHMAFEYFSMILLALLLGQTETVLQHACPDISTRSLGVQDMSWSCKYQSFADKILSTVINLFPEKHIQVIAFIAGPQIQVSLDKGETAYESDDWSFSPSHLVFDFFDLEIMLSHECELNGEMQFKLEDHSHSGECVLMAGSPKFFHPSASDTRYKAHVFLSHNLCVRANGLIISFDESAGKQKVKTIVLPPSKCLLSYQREGLFAFGSMSDALSLSFCWATSLIGLLYMDEISLVIQLISDLSSVLSCSMCDACVGCFQSGKLKEMMKQDQEDFERYEHACDGSINAGKELQYLLRGSLHVKSIDVCLRKSRNYRGVKQQEFDAAKMTEENFFNSGFWISAEPFCFSMFSNYEKTEVFADLPGIHSVIFISNVNMDGFFDSPQSRIVMQKSLDCLAEAYLSNSIVVCELGCQKVMTESEPPYLSGPMQKLQFPSSMVMSVSDQCILINISVGEIFVGKPSVKETLLGVHQMNKFFSSLSVGGEFQIISWMMQGGLFMIEMRALDLFVDYYALFLHHEKYLSTLAGMYVEKTEEMASASHDSRQKRIIPEVLNFDMSQFSLIIVVADQSGSIRELIVEVNITLNCERTATSEKLQGNFSRLSIFSQVIHRDTANETNARYMLSDMMTQEISVSSDAVYTVKEHVGWGRDAIPLQGAASPSSFKTSISEFMNITHKKFILQHLIASVQVEKLNCQDEDSNCAWLGQCSLAGVDLTLSLTDIQVINSVLEPGNDLLQEEFLSKPGPQNTHLLTNQEFEKTFAASIPDGAVVAIQDVDEHMYFTAEGRKGKYRSVGSFHYSIVGKRALFRVKYNGQGVSRSSTVWFSLISLHAKDLLGKPLALAYHRGSSFVEFSGNYSSSWALWRAISCTAHDSSEGFALWEEYGQLSKGTFYLENKKGGCAVAIINGVPEFVHNPGNAFKFKVFKHSDMPSASIPSSPVPGKEQQHHEDIEAKSRPFPCVDIKVEDISVTLVHEILRVEHVFSLIQGRVVDIQLVVHGLPDKVRIIATFKALLDCYETQKNKWRELLRPVEIKIYYRTRLPIHGHIAKLGAPVYLFCKIEELHFSLTEKSIDTLLFISGKLNISGPYEIKEGAILSNCCKVENRTGAFLRCKFYDQQSVKIAGNDATMVYPRYRASENAPVVSLQLAFSGSYSTSTVNMSLLEGRSVAWRTRIVSLEDSRSYPGPFLLVDIDRYSEDGMSIVASPLVKIHNETDYSMELRFQRPQQGKHEFACILLKSGGTMDDTTAMFDSINLSGGVKKAITSLSVGNFLLSFRPKFHEAISESNSCLMADWSGHINGSKAMRLSGIFNKLNYRVRRAFQGKSAKVSTSIVSCAVKSNDALVKNLHFLIQSYERGVPIKPNNNIKEGDGGDAPITLLEQKEILLLPTVRVCNLLLSEIHVLLTDDPNRDSGTGCHGLGNEATILSGSTTNFYADPTKLYIVVTLTAFSSRSKAINSGDWVKRLRGKEVGYLDIVLDFAGGKYFAMLRLSRSHTGTLQAYIFAPHSLKNETDLPLLIHVPHQRNLPREEARKTGLSVTPDIGLVLAPKSSGSWLLKLTKVQVTLLEDGSLKAILDLGSLSGLSEIRLEMMGGPESKPVMKFGVHVGPAFGNLDVPAQCITLVPRHVIVNNSARNVIVRQFFLEDDMAGITTVPSKQRSMLQMRSVTNERRRYNLIENLIRKHQNMKDEMLFVQLRLDDSRYGWSGPVCLTSLGSFFVKFKSHDDQFSEKHNAKLEFAHVHIIEESSSLVLQFHSPPNVQLPYQIENQLPDYLLAYYQKDTSFPEILLPKSSTAYVWDDLTRPRKLVVQINDLDLMREINLDKLREWKPFFKEKRYRGISSQLFPGRKLGSHKNEFAAHEDMSKLGYEVYADGPTRVLRICDSFNCRKRHLPFRSSEKIRVRIPRFVGNLHETKMTEGSDTEETVYTPLVTASIANICFDAIFSDHQRYLQTAVEALNVDPKWTGAPFAAIIRKHYASNYTNHCMLKVVAVVESSFSSVRHVKYLSIVLQPVDLNLDEETLMRIAPFWRSSLSANTKSQQYYFDHFEIHPIKITANFLPGDDYSSYSSSQETLRSLIHSIVKIPPIKNMVVELNGVLITHALITLRELSIRCAQHYSWYAMRAIYLAKGSPLLPPSFASMFDDLASSSLDVFFDPSQGLLKLPGITSNAFKLIRKSLGKQGRMGTSRYLGDLGKTLKSAGSNLLFAAATEISDSVLRGAESNGLDGMVNGFHQGIFKLAMEPSVLGGALLEGGPERIIILDQSPGVDELYVEGYLQAMLDTIYKQEYLRVRVVDNQVFLKNLPPNNALIEEIMDRVRGFLVNRALLEGDPSTSRPLRHLRGEREWKIGPTVVTLCEHLFVSFAISVLRNQATKLVSKVKQTKPEQREADIAEPVAEQIPGESSLELNDKKGKAIIPEGNQEQQKAGIVWRWGIHKFIISGVLAYIDGRLCRCIPNPIVRRIVSGFVLSFLDRNDSK